MGRDIHYKLLTVVFAFIALIAISACAVASSPATTSKAPEPAATEVPEAPDEPKTEPDVTPEPDPTPTNNDDDSASADVSSESSTTDDDDGSLDDSTVEANPRDSDDDAADEADEPEESSPGKPIRLLIDAIDVDAEFEYVGVDDDGNMDVPQDWDNVAWYEPGTIPGGQGNAVIAGHYDSYSDPAVFFDLNELEKGDKVRILTDEGEELVFKVTEIELVHIDEADSTKIFGQTDEHNLNLITCEGAWDTDAGMYDQRLIVYTTLISS